MNKLFKALFIKIDKTIVKLNGWEYIPNSTKKMIYINPHTYKDEDLKLADGTIIIKGDQVAELHIDNLKVGKIKNDLSTLYSILEEELYDLSQAISNIDKYRDIKAYYGVTLLYPIASRKGFTIIEIRDKSKKIFIRIWENILKLSYGKSKAKTNKGFRIPKECWISKSQVLDRLNYKKGD
ncbi:YkoP family protein [Brassicibacter mesophilus]|uniref:YkoP family protein n=1 Tax=Brassicibacter mesophilus TaxID=745119 RepID=UPI003D232C7D